jgi:hypothetical protein
MALSLACVWGANDEADRRAEIDQDRRHVIGGLESSI